jgi:hypothetical protein
MTTATITAPTWTTPNGLTATLVVIGDGLAFRFTDGPVHVWTEPIYATVTEAIEYGEAVYERNEPARP